MHFRHLTEGLVVTLIVPVLRAPDFVGFRGQRFGESSCVGGSVLSWLLRGADITPDSVNRSVHWSWYSDSDVQITVTMDTNPEDKRVYSKPGHVSPLRARATSRAPNFAAATLTDALTAGWLAVPSRLQSWAPRCDSATTRACSSSRCPTTCSARPRSTRTM